MSLPEDPIIPAKTQENGAKPADPAAPVPPLPVVASGLKQPRQVKSEALLQGDREVQIIHGEEIYRLSLTRQGKLILHK
jgi:hemin uptake protein HemP